MIRQVADIETAEILRIAQECLEIEGDFVEMGCYEGDTSILLAEVIQHYYFGHTQGRSAKPMVQNNSAYIKRLYLYDSFEGLPKKTLEDESAAGVAFSEGALAVSKREVKLRFLRAGLPVPIIKKAWFSDLVNDDLPTKIAFAFLDGDLYESIKDSLKLVTEKMAKGGVVIVHDYNNPELPGVSKAVDEWISARKLEQKASLAIIRF